MNKPKIQTKEELEKIQEESQKQTLPEQKKIFSVPEKIRRRVSNLPDPTRPPLGYDPHKAFDRVFPYIRLPLLHPPNHGDTIIFNAPELPANQLILGDNLQVLRTLPSESIDLIYIDPPFFSGRTYNVIWGDSNEVRTFYDIWEGGIDSYLIWLNARLWEMRRVLKKTGSIYVHCDWHASHYIKTEMDKLFGYENFRNEIVWRRTNSPKSQSGAFGAQYDSILFYSKTAKFIWCPIFRKFDDKSLRPYGYSDERGRFRLIELEAQGVQRTPNRRQFKFKDRIAPWLYSLDKLLEWDKKGLIYRTKNGRYCKKQYLDEMEGILVSDLWVDDQIPPLQGSKSEVVGYPTQKPESLLERIIKASSNEGDLVADFFCGGGTTLAVAMKLKRRFIGCDSSRVAISVTLDRLVKLGEEMSGVKSNISALQDRGQSLKKDLFDQEAFQMKLQAEGVAEKVPNIEVSYHSVYPIDKFEHLPQEDFVTFVLTCYGASKNTAGGVTCGFRPPGQSELILVGPANPRESIDAKTVKAFFDEIKSRLEPNKLVKAKIIGWRFSRQVVEYAKILKKYIADNNLPINLELIPLDSKEFRQHILSRFPDIEDAEFYLRFSKPPVIGDIHIKKIGPLEYEFEAIDAFSTNEDGWLVNCQWDFDYQEGHFCADKNYILSREKVKDKIHGEIFKAILKAKHKFEKEGEYIVACKVQDNLAGETTLSKNLEVKNGHKS